MWIFGLKHFLEEGLGLKREKIGITYSWKEKKRNINITISSLWTVTMNRTAKKNRKKRKGETKNTKAKCTSRLKTLNIFMIEYVEHKYIGLFLVLVLGLLVWLVN